jgi:hypothetical protein
LIAFKFNLYRYTTGALRAIGGGGGLSFLKQLALGGTSLGAEGGEMLAEALAAAACIGLERLLLPGAALGPRGVEAVCAALPPGVLLLDLGSNKCGDRGRGLYKFNPVVSLLESSRLVSTLEPIK